MCCKCEEDFEFELGEGVVIDASGETGMVVARAEYLIAKNSYNVRYQCADGRAVEQWWTESALSVS